MRIIAAGDNNNKTPDIQFNVTDIVDFVCILVQLDKRHYINNWFELDLRAVFKRSVEKFCKNNGVSYDYFVDMLEKKKYNDLDIDIKMEMSDVICKSNTGA